MEGSSCDSRDWAHLPLAAVNLISQSVKSITDFVRFRAVCSPWRSATAPKPSHLPPQLPWLMLPYSPEKRKRTDRQEEDDGMRLFYDLWESKMHKLHLPETVGMQCCASYRGWLLLLAPKGKEAFLLNPLTRARIQLPSFTTQVKHLWVRDDLADAPPFESHWYFEPNFAITKVIFSADLTDPNCVITVFLQRWWGIFCCRVGDPCWTIINARHASSEFADATYYNGRFYLLYKGAMSIIDTRTPDRRSVCLIKNELQDARVFLLEGKSGIHVVSLHDIEEEDEATGLKMRKQKFELYQSEEHWFKPKKIADTSNTVVFCGSNEQFLAVCSDDWDSLDGGSLYMEYKRAPYEDLPHGFGSSFSIYRAKLDDGKFKPVVCDIAKEPPLFPDPPAPAMWFQPSFV